MAKDNGIQRGGFGVPKQGSRPPVRRKQPQHDKPVTQQKPKKVTPQPATDVARKLRREREMTGTYARINKPRTQGCAVTAITVGISIVGAVAALRGWA